MFLHAILPLLSIDAYRMAPLVHLMLNGVTSPVDSYKSVPSFWIEYLHICCPNPPLVVLLVESSGQEGNNYGYHQEESRAEVSVDWYRKWRCFKKIVLKVNPTLELSACGWYVFELGGPSSGAFNGDDGKSMNVESGDTVDTFGYLVATLTQWITIDHTTFLTEISRSGVVNWVNGESGSSPGGTESFYH